MDFQGLLPKRFRKPLEKKNNGTIPYDDLTYGDLIGEVKKEGLKLYYQLKFQYQVKKDLKALRKDLRSFCAQYGIQMPIPPSQKLQKQKLYRENPVKKFKKFQKFKPQNSNNNKQKFNKTEVRCFKCGQKGHIAPNCKNPKVNVLSDKEEEYYSENNSSSSETDKSQTTSEKEIEKIENCLCQVNMITADQELFIEMIDQIEDKETKEKIYKTNS